MFFMIDKTIGLPVSTAIEDEGIDEAYHGIPSYPDFVRSGQGFVDTTSPAFPSSTDLQTGATIHHAEFCSTSAGSAPPVTRRAGSPFMESH